MYYTLSGWYKSIHPPCQGSATTGNDHHCIYALHRYNDGQGAKKPPILHPTTLKPHPHIVCYGQVIVDPGHPAKLVAYYLYVYRMEMLRINTCKNEFACSNVQKAHLGNSVDSTCKWTGDVYPSLQSRTQHGKEFQEYSSWKSKTADSCHLQLVHDFICSD